MRFNLIIECDNAAFGDDPDQARSQSRNEEVGRILSLLAGYLEGGAVPGNNWPLYDINGNLVGYAEYKP